MLTLARYKSPYPQPRHYCYDTGLFHPDPPLLPLRTSDLDTEFFHTDMKVLADLLHDQPTVLYCVPTNPGPRSFHAWAIRRCHWPVPQPIVRLLKPYSNLGPPIFRPPKVHEPVPNISRSGPRNPSLTLPSSTSRRPRRDMPQLEPKYNLKATIPSNSC